MVKKYSIIGTSYNIVTGDRQLFVFNCEAESILGAMSKIYDNSDFNIPDVLSICRTDL